MLLKHTKLKIVIQVPYKKLLNHLNLSLPSFQVLNLELKKMIDLDKSEYFILITLAIPTLIFGFYPEPLINSIEVSVKDLIETYNLNLLYKP